MEALVSVAETLAFAFFLVMVVERVTEFVVKPLIGNILKLAGQSEETTAEKLGNILPFVTAVMGATLSYGFGIDLFAGLAASAGLEPAAWLTQLLTAIVLGGGSNLLHDLWPGQYPPIELEIDESAVIRG